MADTVLLVDSDESHADRLEAALTSVGLWVRRAHTPKEGIADYLRNSADAVLVYVDASLKATEFCREIRSAPSGAFVPILFVASKEKGAELRSPSDALQAGGDYFFKAHVDFDYLAGRVHGWIRGVVNGSTDLPLPLPQMTWREKEVSYSSTKEDFGASDTLDILPPEIFDLKNNSKQSYTEGESKTDETPMLTVTPFSQEFEPSEGELPIQAPFRKRVWRKVPRHAHRIESRTESRVESRVEKWVEKRVASEEQEYQKIARMSLKKTNESSLTNKAPVEKPVPEELQEVRENKDPRHIADRLPEHHLRSRLEAKQILRKVSFERAGSHEPLIRGVAPQSHPQSLPKLEIIEAPSTVHSQNTVEAVLDSSLVSDSTVELKVPPEVWASIETDRNLYEQPEIYQQPSLRVVPPVRAIRTQTQDLSQDLEVVQKNPLSSQLGKSLAHIQHLYRNKGFQPERGKLQDMDEALLLLHQLRAQNVTGHLCFGESMMKRLVFTDGLPRNYSGTSAVESLFKLFQELSKSLPDKLVDLYAKSSSTHDVLFAVKELQTLTPSEVRACQERLFEEGLEQFLISTGGWYFDVSESVSIAPDEVLFFSEELRDQLARIVARVVSEEYLSKALGGNSARVRVPSSFLPASRDLRLLSLLDGQTSIENAAQLARMDLRHAYAIAYVYLRTGLATLELHSQSDSSVQSNLNSSFVSSQPLPVPEAIVESKIVESKIISAHSTLHKLPLKERLHAIVDLIRRSDYFSILGIRSDADVETIWRAHESLKSIIPLVDELKQEPELRGLAREALRGVNEAKDVLCVPELREAYRKHLTQNPGEKL